FGYETLVRERRQQLDSAVTSEQPFQSTPYRRSRMNWNDKFNVFEFVHDFTNCFANGLHSAPVILATMRRQQNTSEAATLRGTCLRPLECKPQRINPCVPCKKHSRGVNAFSM